MGRKAGRENCCTLAEKALQRLGKQNIHFSTEHVYPQPTAALHGGSNHGWEGRVGKRTCWLVCRNFFRDFSFQVALMEASLAALRMVRAEKLSHSTSLFAEI